MLLLKFAQAAFAVACFWGLSEVTRYLDAYGFNGSIDISIGQADSWSPHNWLMRLPMYLATLWSWR